MNLFRSKGSVSNNLVTIYSNVINHFAPKSTAAAPTIGLDKSQAMWDDSSDCQ